MLKSDDKLAIYLEGTLGNSGGKMGYGVLRYSHLPVVAVIDSKKAGQSIKKFAPINYECPIVENLAQAKALGATVLILGIAPPGGIIPDSWYLPIDEAVHLGFSIVNGLHTKLAPRYSTLSLASQWIWDIRNEPENIGIAHGQARLLPNKRVLFVGSDMAIGKMTAALEIHRSAQARGIKSAFVATGQIGITISGKGIPLDAIRLDYACGAVEQAVLDEKDAELILVEGQGSLCHPASTATLPLLRGSCPTHLIFCHRANQEFLSTEPDIKIPPVLDLIKAYQDVAEVCGTYARPKIAGICLNTGHLNADDAERATLDMEKETGLITVDVIRQGANRLIPMLV